MSATAVFAFATLVAPVLAVSLLHRICKHGPKNVSGDRLTSLAVIVALATSLIAVVFDFSVVKLIGMAASGLISVLLVCMSSIFIAYNEEFCESTL